MNTTQTKAEAQAASIVLGSLVKIQGVKTAMIVTEVHRADCFTVAGPRGNVLIESCGTHWIRWSIKWGAAPREILVEWVKAPVEA